MLTRSRRGVTLVEILVAIVLAGTVAAAVVRSRHASHAAATDALARTDARRQLRAGAGAVLASLYAAAPAGGDLLTLADTALELRVTLGGSVVCAASAGALDLPPSITLALPVARDAVADSADVAAPIPVAGWHDAPAPGDELLVLLRGQDGVTAADSGAARWRWRTLRVAAGGVPTRAPCLGAPLASAIRVALVTPPPIDLVAGMPMRLLRRGRWSVYRSRGRWFLGWRDVAATGVGLDAVQPVSGPHDAPDMRGAWQAGLAFSSDPHARDTIASRRVRIVSLVAIAPVARSDRVPVAESLVVSAALRNAPP